MAKDQRTGKVVAELRRRIANLEAVLRRRTAAFDEENLVLKNYIHKLKTLQPSKARPGGCG